MSTDTEQVDRGSGEQHASIEDVLDIFLSAMKREKPDDE
jgi:hypothetical protein